METSEARREANRRNAQKSTGPKTDAGKARSRQNALKHGLTAKVVDLELGPIPPRDPAAPSGSGWLLEQVGRVQVQITRAQRIEAKLRDLAAWRATTLWDSDRRVEAEDRGAALKREPARTVAKLRQTPHGCDWLLERWQILARAAEGCQAWSDEQVRLAFDLLGTPAEGRSGFPGTTLDPQLDGGQSRLALARQAIAGLAAERILAEEADELEQILATDDFRDTPTPELARLRRYELALHKRLQWLTAELRVQGLAQAPVVPPTPEPKNSAWRDEAIEPTSLDESKPTPTEPDSTSNPEVPRHRPDLTRLNHRNRQDRRRSKRNQRSA